MSSVTVSGSLAKSSQHPGVPPHQPRCEDVCGGGERPRSADWKTVPCGYVGGATPRSKGLTEISRRKKNGLKPAALTSHVSQGLPYLQRGHNMKTHKYPQFCSLGQSHLLNRDPIPSHVTVKLRTSELQTQMPLGRAGNVSEESGC